MGILSDVKDFLGVEKEFGFDAEILMNINSAIATLYQNGACETSYIISSDEDPEWEELIPQNVIGHAKQFVYLQVRTMFDTSTTASYVLECMQKQAKECLWRIREELEGEDYADG